MVTLSERWQTAHLQQRQMSTAPYPRVYLYRRMVQAKLFIDSHYAGNIDLANIADEACFSRFHFIRLFKQLYSQTPHQYLISVRVAHAMQLLRKGQPVSDVCYAVGFESLGSFSSLFKRVVGIAPSVYLQQQQERKIKMQQSPLAFVPGCFAEKNGWLKK